MVLLGRRAQRAIAQINSSANTLRHELLAGISASQLEICMNVLARIRERADNNDKVDSKANGASAGSSARRNGQNKQRDSIRRKGSYRRKSK
jgi:hypothetical protein